MRTRYQTAMLGVVGAALLLASCGSSDVEPTTTATAGPTAGPTAVPTQTATATPTPQPGVVFSRYLQAQGLLRSGQYKESIPQFDVVIRIHPDFAEAFLGRGLAYYNEERKEFALADFNKAIELKPDYADAYRNRGVLYSNRGDVSLAVPDLQRALTLYEQRGELEKAAGVRSILGGLLR